MDWKLVDLDEPNAWLSATTKFSEFLRLVYEWNSGEIWLYNNDLSVLFDEPLFEELYLDLIDGKLKDKIEAIKFLLSEDNYEKLTNPSNHRKLQQHLRQLSTETLRKFYVGRVTEQIKKKVEKFDLDSNVIFYTWKGHLSYKRGVAIVRHNVSIP